MFVGWTILYEPTGVGVVRGEWPRFAVAVLFAGVVPPSLIVRLLCGRTGSVFFLFLCCAVSFALVLVLGGGWGVAAGRSVCGVYALLSLFSVLYCECVFRFQETGLHVVVLPRPKVVRVR